MRRTAEAFLFKRNPPRPMRQRLQNGLQWDYLRCARRDRVVRCGCEKGVSSCSLHECTRSLLSRSWLLLAFIFLLAFCPAVARAATKVVTDADKGGTVQIKMGDVLEVRLSSNPTTGYEWYLAETIDDVAEADGPIADEG